MCVTGGSCSVNSYTVQLMESFLPDHSQKWFDIYHMPFVTGAVLMGADSLAIASMFLKLKLEIVHNIDLQS